MTDEQNPTPPDGSPDDGPSEVELLRIKNKELLDEKRKLREVHNGTEATIEELQAQYDRDVAALDAKVAELEGRLRELSVISPAMQALAGIVHEPKDVFLTTRLRPEMLEIGDDGLPVVIRGDQRVPLAEWANRTLPRYMLKAPPPQGSGAPAGGSMGLPLQTPAGMRNPFLAPHYSLGEQMRLARGNPALYEQLKRAALNAFR